MLRHGIFGQLSRVRNSCLLSFRPFWHTFYLCHSQHLKACVADWQSQFTWWISFKQNRRLLLKLTLIRLVMNNKRCPLEILRSPTEEFKWISISGITVNPNHIWSEGGGFTYNLSVPRRDATLIPNESGTWMLKIEIQWLEIDELLPLATRWTHKIFHSLLQS